MKQTFACDYGAAGPMMHKAEGKLILQIGLIMMAIRKMMIGIQTGVPRISCVLYMLRI